VENAASLSADAVICPSYQLGTLAERKLIAPLPKDLPRQWSGIFDVLRLAEATWGPDVAAVPFGSPVFVCYYRADLLEKLRRKPPRTWGEYQRLAEFLADRRNLGDAAPPEGAPWCGTLEPLARGWAGLVLLARAAPYAKSPSNYSVLFDIKTMEPLIAGPPMQRALEELVAASKCGLPEQLQYGPAEVRTAFWQGRCGMALSWPSAATAKADGRAPGETGTGSLPAKGEKPGGIQVGFIELPGSPEVYDRSMPGLRFSSRAPLDDPHVPLLTVAGRVGAVARESSQAEAARELLFWLSGDQMSPLVSAASPATTLFRRSHLKSPELWVESAIPRLTAEQYATTIEQTLRREQWVCALRIPGRAEYMAALDDAVQRALQGKQAPIEALYQAAKRWQEITEKRGVQQQRQAYRRSLGLD